MHKDAQDEHGDRSSVYLDLDQVETKADTKLSRPLQLWAFSHIFY